MIAGSKISELSVAAEIGISRTPVREAIGRLQFEGLVEQVPRLGTIVRQIDRRDLVELYETRHVLETFAVGRAAENLDAAQLKRLRIVCEAMQEICDSLPATGDDSEAERPTLSRFLSLDLAFHRWIIEAGGNRRIAETVRQMQVLSSIFRMRRQKHSHAVLADACAAHWRIFNALESRDSQAAQENLGDHIQNSAEHALAHFERVDKYSAVSAMTLDLPEDVARRLSEADNGSENGSETSKGVRRPR